MSSRDETKVPLGKDLDYVKIVHSNVKVDKSFLEEEGKPAKISYYCKNCKKAVPAEKMGKKLSFKCGECGQENISFGSEESVVNYYRKFKGHEE